MNVGALLCKREWIAAVGMIRSADKVVASGRCLQPARASGCTPQPFLLILLSFGHDSGCFSVILQLKGYILLLLFTETDFCGVVCFSFESLNYSFLKISIFTPFQSKSLSFAAMFCLWGRTGRVQSKILQTAEGELCG